ncbi:hypothetical protein MUP35_01925 [Patescibacteria group bacterium]|nr:hypothetical protein [Patescibacteria group bacterium]
MEKKELNVCKELKAWFERYGIKCWLNVGENKFTTKLSQKKPDMIIFSGLLKQYIAVEVKPGDSSKDLYDASKIIEYWEEYEQKKIDYYINEQKIEISSFAVASLFSPMGKLFQDDDEPHISKDKDWEIYNQLTKLEPRYEYRRTHDYLRGVLWASWNKKREKKKQAGIGIIISDILNQEELQVGIGQPMLFDAQYENQRSKPKWQNRQKKL